MHPSTSMILGIYKNNIFNTLQFISSRRHEIDAHIRGETYEGLNGGGTIIPNMTNTEAIILLTFSLLIWLWALYITVKYFNRLPIISQIFAILGLLGFGGPVVTLLAVYIGLNNLPPAKRSTFLGKY